jgi:hypothetical protein
MPAANGDGYSPDAEIFPGIRQGVSAAPGSAGASGPGDNSIPAGPVTRPDQMWQSATRPSLVTSGSTMAGQTEDGLTNLDHHDITSTGAGSGHTDAWARRPWQNRGGAS